MLKKNVKTKSDRSKNNTKNIFEKESKIILLNLSQKYSSFINLILIELILILLPKRILSVEPNIELKVISKGYHQILSESYSGIKPSAIYVNNEVQVMKELKIYVESPEHIIRLEWDNTLTNFAYMFSNLTSITSVKMNYISRNGCYLSYMLYNCNNLQNFSYISYYNSSYIVRDTISMFYNCSSLKTFSFNNLYMACSDNYFYSCSHYNGYYRNMSYMFYNCENLKSITSNNYIFYVKDMRGMFYNCQSLKSINLDNFRTNGDYTSNYANLSYMFYNCKNLSSFRLQNNFCVKDMNNMFYNCESLTSINFNYFLTSYYYLFIIVIV